MAIVVTEYEIEINGKRIEAQVIGRCTRALTGAIECEVENVLSPEGLSLMGVVAQDDFAPMKRRLWCAALEQRHPRGEGEEAAV